MKLAVLGASGQTGRLVAAQAITAGHDVTAVVRNPAKSPDGVTTAVAEGTDADAQATAFAGAGAVASCIGPVTDADADAGIMEASAAATIRAMQDAGVSRLVMISASGPFTDGDGPFTRRLVKPILHRALRNAFADMVAAEGVIRGSDLDWTIVRPPMLTNGRGRSHYRAQRDRNVRRGMMISRADLATAMIDALEDPTTIGRAISVAR